MLYVALSTFLIFQSAHLTSVESLVLNPAAPDAFELEYLAELQNFEAKLRQLEKNRFLKRAEFRKRTGSEGHSGISRRSLHGIFQPKPVTGPCTFPKPNTNEFHIFCQSTYHQTNYICDPSGLLSRTEVELLDKSVKKMNISSCFCGIACSSDVRMKIGIVVVPSANVQSIQHCDQTLDFIPPNSLSSAAYMFTTQLKDHWKEDCHADILLVYISSWSPEHIKKPYIVPLYSNSLERIYRYSTPTALNPREAVLDSLQNVLRSTNRLMKQSYTEVNTSIPTWALGLAFGMIFFVCFAVYIANWVTNKIGRGNQKQKSSIQAVVRSERFRAGFGGGMMMSQQSNQNRKSTMMFRSFNKSRYANNNNTNRI